MRLGRWLLIGGAAAVTSWLVRRGRENAGDKVWRKARRAARKADKAMGKPTGEIYP